LDHAHQTISELVAEIAPLIKLTQNPHLEAEPAGEELPEVSLQSKTFGKMANQMVLSSEDLSNVFHFAGDATHGVVELLRPPDPSGYPAGSQVPQPTPQPPS
jgi:hypothetical protein